MPPVFMRIESLHNRCELDITAVDFFEKVIEIKWIVCIEIINHRKSVPFHSVLVKQIYTLHHLAE